MNSRREQSGVAYLGPRGTFAEAALLALSLDSNDAIAADSVTAAIDLVRSGTATGAVVPIENSVEGSVSTTLDELASGSPLVITAEIALPVRFSLMAREGLMMEDIRSVATHPHAQAQCAAWLRQHLPEAQLIPATSTAGAAAALAQSSAGEPIAFDAAIAQRLAADHYGLSVLADDIGDNDEATTRFIVVRQPGVLPQRTGADKTTLVVFMTEDHTGALLEILTELAVRGVNMTRIESRPTRRAMGDYFFSIDCEGHIADDRVAEALKGLHRICRDVRFLGSYPRHDGKSALLRDGVGDGDFVDADAWLARIRSGTA